MPAPLAATALADRLAGPRPPLVVDVRRPAAYAAAATALPGALRRPPETAARWGLDLPSDRPVVAYCVHGQEVSQAAAAALEGLGREAAWLEGGIEAWRAAGRPLAGKPAGGGLWVTRERPKIDRLACPWLVRRFVDAEAAFLYVPAEQVLEVAAATGATPYDIPGVAFGHAGERCSFDAFLAHYRLAEPGLERLATIVRGADTDRFDLAPQAAGLFAVSLGLSHLFADDQALLQQGLLLYDALHAWCRSLQSETHGWPPRAAA